MTPLLALSPAALAASFERVPDWFALTEQSRGVIVGVVVSARTARAPYGLVTQYEIAVEQTLAGEAEPTVAISLPGGRIDGLVQRFGGVPLWAVGDAVVVFVPDAGPVALTGLLTLRGDQLIDPLGRPDPVRSVGELRGRIAGATPLGAVRSDWTGR